MNKVYIIYNENHTFALQHGVKLEHVKVCLLVYLFILFKVSHQVRKFSMLESWMNSHTSDLTSVNSDFHITGENFITIILITDQVW